MSSRGDCLVTIYGAMLKYDDIFKKVQRRFAKPGRPDECYSLALMIDKQGKTDWKDTEWGSEINEYGKGLFRGGVVPDRMSWKVIDGKDGDEGYWIIWLQNDLPPSNVSIYCSDTGELVPVGEKERGLFTRGSIVTVVLSFKSNGSQSKQTDGLIVNLKMMALTGKGKFTVRKPCTYSVDLEKVAGSVTSGDGFTLKDVVCGNETAKDNSRMSDSELESYLKMSVRSAL